MLSMQTLQTRQLDFQHSKRLHSLVAVEEANTTCGVCNISLLLIANDVQPVVGLCSLVYMNIDFLVHIFP